MSTEAGGYWGPRRSALALWLRLEAKLPALPEDVLRRVRESWTKGSSGVRPVIHWAGPMGCEDMKAEDYTRVRIGLSLAWKASLAANYEDSFLCNRLYVTLDPPGVYINRRT